MSTIKAIFRNGRIETEEPLDLPEGTEWMISLPNDTPDAPMSPEAVAGVHTTTRRFAEIDFMTEDEQSDDPVIVQQWIDDLRSIPPIPQNVEKEAEWRDWEEKMRLFNIEAVRKQFEGGTP